MPATFKTLAAAWLTLLVVIFVPLAGTEAQSPTPPPQVANPPPPFAAPSGAAPAPGLSPDKVRTEIDQFTKFLQLLSRGKVEEGQPRLVLSPRYDAVAKKLSLNADDEKHVKEVQGQLPALEAFKQLDPEKQSAINAAFDALTAPLDPTAGVTDPQVIQFDANRDLDSRIARLATSMDALVAVLEQRKNAAGLTNIVPAMYVPKPAAPGAGPSPTAGLPPPAPLADDGPGAPAPISSGGAGGRPGPVASQLPPCSDARERVTAARKATTSAIKPIDDLISAGDRALTNRYFPLARDAYEKAVERLVELEREWRDIAESLKPPTYSNQDLLDASCTAVLTAALTNAIAMNDILQRLYPKLGEVYTELGQNEQAAREIAKSVQINPHNAKTWAALGNAYLRSDQSDEAIKAFLRSVELDTYVPDVWLGLAKAYARKKENQIAIHYIRRAVSKGFVKFEKLAADPDFMSLQGITEFDDLVYLVPGAQPFPR